eukprot:CAMPEP_0114559394 /NCGR_PEP_ID=MMETSP0114-20121206/10898_1 /TAXON_ID=31324 /ORGANISM="Goniomonas sp, Strain m" /LENGTH=71 /DNA_ID=CAMNT_0001744861 /DNA_START=692 /DNA_END=907 /DNA_ORIENTATION=+
MALLSSSPSAVHYQAEESTPGKEQDPEHQEYFFPGRDGDVSTTISSQNITVTLARVLACEPQVYLVFPVNL